MIQSEKIKQYSEAVFQLDQGRYLSYSDHICCLLFGLNEEMHEYLGALERPFDVNAILGEAGDILWYTMALSIAEELDFMDIFQSFPKAKITPKQLASKIAYTQGLFKKKLRKNHSVSGAFVANYRTQLISTLKLCLSFLYGEMINIETLMSDNIEKLQKRVIEGTLTAEIR